MVGEQVVPMVVGLFFIVLGLFMSIWNRQMMQFQIWTQKTIMGARYIPSGRTYKFLIILGIFFIALGILIFISGLFFG